MRQRMGKSSAGEGWRCLLEFLGGGAERQPLGRLSDFRVVPDGAEVAEHTVRRDGQRLVDEHLGGFFVLEARRQDIRGACPNGPDCLFERAGESIGPGSGDVNIMLLSRQDSDAAVLVAPPELETKLRPIAASLRRRFVLTDELMGSGVCALPEVRPERRALILYASGTRKAVCSDQDNAELFGRDLKDKIVCLPISIGSTSAGATWDRVAHRPNAIQGGPAAKRKRKLK
jgi:hypothetical protein